MHGCLVLPCAPWLAALPWLWGEEEAPEKGNEGAQDFVGQFVLSLEVTKLGSRVSDAQGAMEQPL